MYSLYSLNLKHLKENYSALQVKAGLNVAMIIMQQLKRQVLMSMQIHLNILEKCLMVQMVTIL